MAMDTNDSGEDSADVYRREFKERKIREAQEASRRKTERQTATYWLLRKLCFPIALLAIVIIADDFLPVQTEKEYPQDGYQVTVHQKYSSRVHSYMQTDHYEFVVPNELHLNYDYNAEKKQPVYLQFTPIFKTLKYIGIDRNEYRITYYADSIYRPWYKPVPYILLFLCVFFIKRKEYTIYRYHLGFMPLVIALILLFIMFILPAIKISH